MPIFAFFKKLFPFWFVLSLLAPAGTALSADSDRGLFYPGAARSLVPSLKM